MKEAVQGDERSLRPERQRRALGERNVKQRRGMTRRALEVAVPDSGLEQLPHDTETERLLELDPARRKRRQPSRAGVDTRRCHERALTNPRRTLHDDRTPLTAGHRARALPHHGELITPLEKLAQPGFRHRAHHCDPALQPTLQRHQTPTDPLRDRPGGSPQSGPDTELDAPCPLRLATGFRSTRQPECPVRGDPDARDGR